MVSPPEASEGAVTGGEGRARAGVRLALLTLLEMDVIPHARGLVAEQVTARMARVTSALAERLAAVARNAPVLPQAGVAGELAAAL